MDKGSFFYLLLFCAITLLATYDALFPLSASTAFVRFLGLAGFLMLCVSLIMGPLALISPKDFAILLVHRRAIGIISFVAISAHLVLSFWVQYNWNIVSFISTGPAAVLAVLATLMLIALTATSSDWAVKTFKQWKNIQRLAYVAFVFSFAHFILKSNGLFAFIGGKVFVNLSEVAMVFLGLATIWLQLWGFYTVTKRKSASVPASAPPPFAPTQAPPAPAQEEQN